MKEVMNPWNKMKDLIYRPEFFRNRSLTFKGGLHFYSLLLLFFITLRMVLLLPTGIRVLQAVASPDWQKQKTIITDLYPDDLRLVMKEGVVSTNVSEPYPIAIPEAWRSTEDGLPKNFAVIDTTKPIETNDFAEQDTFFILGKNGFGYRDQAKGEFRIYDFHDKGWNLTTTVDKARYESFITQASAVLQRLIVVGCIVLPFALYALLWFAYLAYLVFGALIVLLGVRLQGYRIGYAEAYKAGLYLMVVPFLYEFLSSFGQGLTFNIPFAFTTLLFIMTLINFPKRVGPGAMKPSSPDGASVTTEIKPDVPNDPVS